MKCSGQAAVTRPPSDKWRWMLAAGVFAASYGCAGGDDTNLAPEPQVCPEEMYQPVARCINDTFIARGERGWTLDVSEVIAGCVEVSAALPTQDAGADAGGPTWPAACESQVHTTYNSPPEYLLADTPGEVVVALEDARDGCPSEPATCRISSLTYEVSFGGRPGVLELDAAIDIARQILPAPRTWEERLGELGPRSLPQRDIETVMSALGASGQPVVESLAAQGTTVEFGRLIRVIDERRERIQQDVIVTLAKQGDTSLLILVEVDLPVG